MKFAKVASNYTAVALLLAVGIFASGLQASSYSTLVPAAVKRTLSMPQVIAKMSWVKGGITAKEVLQLMEILEPEAYAALQYLAVEQRSENADQLLLDTAIHNYAPKKLFRLETPTTTRYFWGKKPDIKAIVSKAAFSDKMITEMDWEAGRNGLSSDRMIQEIAKLYPAVYELYVQSTDDKSDNWLRRIVAGMVYSDHGKERLGYIFFTKRMKSIYGKELHIYYKGFEPDVEYHLLEAIANDANLVAAMHEPEGATMDEIVGAIREHSPSFYQLYTALNKGSLIMSGGAYFSRTGDDTNLDDLAVARWRNYEHGLRSVLGKAMSNMQTEDMQITRGKNRAGKTTYRFVNQ